MSESVYDELSTQKEFIKNNLLNKYYIELNDDLTLSIKNIQHKNLLCSSIRAKWLMYLTKEKENRKLLKKAKENLKSVLLDAKNVTEAKSILKQKSEDSLLKDNDQLKKINTTIEQLDEAIIFLEYAWTILNDFNYNIKNVIDMIKLEQV
jgi:hypothetical protein